ncbi:MAG: hypothetical protein L0322_25795, partial [Chloroflexi bacterium]|nr:hypothetical protein [Chloroflexota bacterium]
MSAIEIRPVSNVTDCEQIEEVQRLAWRMDDIEIIPSRLLHALEHNGACLLGAYDGEKIVGFAFGVLGTRPGPAADQLQMYSAITGVLPEYQVSGVGHQLKLAQREVALRLGLELITWTYDPLESRNAHFNVNKLGVTCQRYIRHFHGDMSGINAGLTTDRFHVDWWIASDRVRARVSALTPSLTLASLLAGGAVLVNEAGRHAGLPIPPEEFLDSPAGALLVAHVRHRLRIVRQ